MSAEPTPRPDANESPDDAERDAFLAASKERGPGLAGEVAAFVRETGKWWLLPLILAFAVLVLLAAFGGSTAGPFVYTLF